MPRIKSRVTLRLRPVLIFAQKKSGTIIADIISDVKRTMKPRGLVKDAFIVNHEQEKYIYQRVFLRLR